MPLLFSSLFARSLLVTFGDLRGGGRLLAVFNFLSLGGGEGVLRTREEKESCESFLSRRAESGELLSASLAKETRSLEDRAL